MDILYIDATVRSCSRTAQLADHLLKKLEGDVTRLKLSETEMPLVDAEFLSKRDAACASGDLSDRVFDLAKQFSQADIIVIAAPFWDLSFPARLKQYFELINVIGLTFTYTESGRPMGLCKAGKLYYLTTAGGKIFSEEYGFGYVRALAGAFYGIEECVLFKAESLDIYGADTEKIMLEAKEEINREMD